MAISPEKQQLIAKTRRKQIVDSAMELFDQHGYSNTKISDIAEKAGISKGLTYHYFKSKEDLVLAVIDRVDACVRECEQVEDALDAIRLFTLRLLSYPYYQGYVPPMRVFFTALIRGEIQIDEQSNPIREDFGRTYFKNLFERGQAQGYFKEGNPEQFGDLYWKCLIGYMSMMNIDKELTEYHPDVEYMLAPFRK